MKKLLILLTMSASLVAVHGNRVSAEELVYSDVNILIDSLVHPETYSHSSTIYSRWPKSLDLAEGTGACGNHCMQGNQQWKCASNRRPRFYNDGTCECVPECNN